MISSVRGIHHETESSNMRWEEIERNSPAFVHRAEAHDEIALRIIRSATIRAVKMNERAGGLSCGIDIQALISALDGIRNDCNDPTEQGHVLVEADGRLLCIDVARVRTR